MLPMATLSRRTVLVIGSIVLAAGCSESGVGKASRGASAATNLIGEALLESDTFARAARLGTLLPTLGPEAAPEARATLGNRTIDLGVADIILLVRFWATHEPEAATDWAWAHTVKFGMGPLYEASEVWASIDPEAVIARIRKFGPGPANTRVEKALVRGWMNSDLPGLEDYILSLGGISDSGQRALRAYCRARIRRDGPEAVMRWAESIPDEP
jgi:hypothetical protein